MIIKNIINAINGEQHGEYINSLNIINSILIGSYKTNNDNYNDDDEALKVCEDLLRYQYFVQEIGIWIMLWIFPNIL